MSVIFSGGPNVYDQFTAAGWYDWMVAVQMYLDRAGWSTVREIPAYTYASIGANTSSYQDATLGSLHYRLKTSVYNPQSGDVKLGATAADTLANFATAINGGAGSGTLYSSATPVNPDCVAIGIEAGPKLRIESRTGGADANNIGCYGNFWTRINFAPNVNLDQGGWMLAGLTPKGLRMRVKLWLYSRYQQNQVALQAFSTDETHWGYLHRMLTGNAAANLWSINASPCAFYIGGVNAKNLGTSIQIGMPWTPDEPEVTEAWFSAGSFSGSPWVMPPDWRAGFHTDGRAESRCWNGTVYIGQIAGLSDSCPHLLPWSHPQQITGTRQVKWYYGNPLYFDPLVMFASTRHIVRGQLYDAYTRSNPTAPEVEEVYFDPADPAGGTFTYANYTDMSQLGALFILKGTAEGSQPGVHGNYCY